MKTFRLNPFPYLPSCKVNHTSKHHAFKVKLFGESLSSTPKSVIVDGIISYGGGTGIGLKLPRKAFGEFYERNHLFTQVPIHKQKKLNEVQPKKFREKLASLCKNKTNDKGRCLEHFFSFTTVKNLFDEAPQDYFYNAISLNCNRADSPYLNFSDSCASASHPSKEKALYNSLMEFIERQALLGSWLSKNYVYTINPQILTKISPYTELIDMLIDNGELVIVQNGIGLPGHTVIIFYFTKSEQDIVKYSIGSSTGLTLEEALCSAIEELYQCYSFLYNSESARGLENKAGADYHLAFQKCNRMDIKETIPFMKSLRPYQINTTNDLLNLKRYEYNSILAELETISNDIYYYHQYDKSLGFHHTKVLSPDFFAHMSLNNHINIDNKYAKKIGIKKESAFWGKIPFP